MDWLGEALDELGTELVHASLDKLEGWLVGADHEMKGMSTTHIIMLGVEAVKAKARTLSCISPQHGNLRRRIVPFRNGIAEQPSCQLPSNTAQHPWEWKRTKPMAKMCWK